MGVRVRVRARARARVRVGVGVGVRVRVRVRCALGGSASLLDVASTSAIVGEPSLLAGRPGIGWCIWHV